MSAVAGVLPYIDRTTSWTNVALWRMTAALEAQDHERTATIAEKINPRYTPIGPGKLRTGSTTAVL